MLLVRRSGVAGDTPGFGCSGSACHSCILIREQGSSPSEAFAGRYVHSRDAAMHPEFVGEAC